jgi:hypothetical protein
MTGMERQWMQSGLRIEQFTKVIGENASTLARFGSTVSEGAESFTKVVGNLSQGTDDTLRRIGMTADDMSESTASYLSQQVKLGRSQNMSVKELTEGSKNYALELDQLSRATGASRKELENQRKAALDEDKFAASIYLMERQGKKEEVERMIRFQQEIAERVGPTVAKGMRDTMSEGGLAYSDAAKTLAAQTGGASIEIAKMVKAGTMTQNEGMNALQEAASKNAKSVAQNASILGESAGIYGKSFHEFRNIVNLNTDADKKALAEQKARLDSEDKITKGVTETEQNVDRLYLQYHNQLNKVLPTFTEAVQKATEKLNQGGDFLDKLTGRQTDQGTEFKIGEGAMSATLTNIGPAKGTFKEQAPQVMSNLMKDFGLTKEQAAGIVGNLGHESAGLQAGIQEKNPRGGGRGGLGWAQWTGPRRVKFEKYLQQTGQKADDPNANYGFLKYELEHDYKKSIESVKKESRLSGAAVAFEQSYLVAGEKNYPSRVKYAQQAYDLGPAAAGEKKEQQPVQPTQPTATTTPAKPEPAPATTTPAPTTAAPPAQPEKAKATPLFTIRHRTEQDRDVTVRMTPEQARRSVTSAQEQATEAQPTPPTASNLMGSNLGGMGVTGFGMNQGLGGFGGLGSIGMMGGLGGIMGTRRQMPFGGMSPISLINLFGRLGSSVYSGQTTSPIGGIFGGGMTRPGGGLLGGLGNLGMTGFGGSAGMAGGLGGLGNIGMMGGMMGGLGGIMGTRRQSPFGGMSPISLINLFGRLGSSVYSGQSTSPIGGIFGGTSRPGGELLGGLGDLGMTGIGGQSSSGGLLGGLLSGGSTGGGLFGGLFDNKKSTGITTPDTPLAGPESNYSSVANEAPAKTVAENIPEAPVATGVDKMSNLTDMMTSETAKLDEMIALMRKQNTTSDKLLKAQT